MPTPQVKTPEEPHRETDQPDPDTPEPNTPPARDDQDSSGGSLLGLSRGVWIGLGAVAAVVVFYIYYMSSDAPLDGVATKGEDIDVEMEESDSGNANAAADAGGRSMYEINRDVVDPLDVDRQLIKDTDIFPSLSDVGEA